MEGVSHRSVDGKVKNLIALERHARGFHSIRVVQGLVHNEGHFGFRHAAVRAQAVSLQAR